MLKLFTLQVDGHFCILKMYYIFRMMRTSYYSKLFFPRNNYKMTLIITLAQWNVYSDYRKFKFRLFKKNLFFESDYNLE